MTIENKAKEYAEKYADNCSEETRKHLELGFIDGYKLALKEIKEQIKVENETLVIR